MGKQMEQFEPNEMDEKSEIIKEFQKNANDLVDKLKEDLIVNHVLEKHQSPPVYVIISLRMFFAFVKPDHLMDFHLNWLNWAPMPGDNLPCICNYQLHEDKKEHHGKTFRKIIDDIEHHISLAKMKKVYTFYNKNKEHIDELQKHPKLWPVYVLLVEFVVMTVKVMYRIYKLQDG